jgi:hypothetical protein
MFWQILHYYGGIQIQATLAENDAMPRIFLDYCIPDDPSSVQTASERVFTGHQDLLNG